jgi:hypothetical protein
MNTAKRYPLCHKAGILRTISKGHAPGAVVVSSKALHDYLGNRAYQVAILHLTHVEAGWSADSVERMLRERKKSC